MAANRNHAKLHTITRIVSWNMRSFTARLGELDLLMYEINLDLLFLCETRLPHDSVIRFPGFDVYNINRNSHGGGAAFLIKRDIEYSPIDIDKISIEHHCKGIDV